MSVRVPESACPSCGRVNDAATNATEQKGGPEPGDMTVCLCGAALQFGEWLQLEPLDWDRLGEEERKTILAVQNAVLDIEGEPT